MFRTIIIGVDGRPQDAETLALATQLGEPDAEIIAACIALDGHGPSWTRSLRRAQSQEAHAEDIVDAFTESRVRTEGVVSHATSVGAGLRALAIGAGADLIVVASSRRGVLGRVLAGETARDVLRHAPCPVAVAPVGTVAAGPLRQVVAGFDGTDESECALELAAELGRRDGASISVVDVVEPLVISGVAGAYAGDTIVADSDRAKADLESVAERLGLSGVIAVGSAARELAQASTTADLLCVGLHEHPLVDRLLSGSTAHGLLHAQQAPLLLVPRTDPDGHRGPTDALDGSSVSVA